MSHSVRALQRLCLVGLAWAGAVGKCDAELTIDNFQAGDQVRYPVAILRGIADGKEMAVGTSWKEAIRFPVIHHRYTAFVQLKPGKNMLLLHAGSESMKFRLDYKPSTSVHRVLTVLVSASDEKDELPSSDRRFNPDALPRIGIAMKLAQAFAGDAMARGGYERKSFNLELNFEGQVKIHRLKSPKTGSELRQMDAGAIFSHIQELVKTQLATETAKWCAFMAFSRFEPESQKSLAQFSQANESQAVFGTNDLVWWPLTFKAVPKAFADAQAIDPTKAFDDSGNRKTVWSNLSTGYGTVIHELSRTFGVNGSSDPNSVMSRGFDQFSRAFTQAEATIEGRSTPLSFSKDEIPKWDPFYSALLNWNRWFQPDSPKAESFETSLKPTLVVTGDEILVDAPYGLRVIGAQNEASPAWFMEYREPNPVRRVKLSLSSIRSKFGEYKGDLTLQVEDDHGQMNQLVIH